MGMVKDVAKITVSGRPLPDVNGSELGVNAWLLWESAKKKALAVKGYELRQHDGAPGVIWRGTATGVFNELWAGMRDSYTGDKSEALRARTAISKYLRDTNNMVCLDRGVSTSLPSAQGQNRLPTWWIRSDWSDAPPPPPVKGIVPTYTERRLTPHEAGEDRVPEPVTVSQEAPRPKPTPPPARPAPAPAPPTSPARGTAKFGANRDEQRNRVVAILSEIYHGDDIERASTKEIAETLGIGEGSIYGMFTSIGELRRLVSSDAGERLTDEFICPVEGCGLRFESSQGRASHLRGHGSRDRMIEAAIHYLTERGDSINAFTTQEIADRVGMKFGASVYGQFRDKSELLETSRRIAENRGIVFPAYEGVSEPKSVDPAEAGALQLEVTEKIYALAAFATEQQTPLPRSILVNVPVGVPAKVRETALDSLVTAKRLVLVEARDARSRPVTVYVSQDPAPQPERGHLAAVKALIADYERLLGERLDQSALDRAERARKVAEARAHDSETELADLKSKLSAFTDLLGR